MLLAKRRRKNGTTLTGRIWRPWPESVEIRCRMERRSPTRRVPETPCSGRVGDRRSAAARNVECSGWRNERKTPHPWSLPLNLTYVAADVRRRKGVVASQFRLLTSSATVQGFKPRILREILSPSERRGNATSLQSIAAADKTVALFRVGIGAEDFHEAAMAL